MSSIQLWIIADYLLDIVSWTLKTWSSLWKIIHWGYTWEALFKPNDTWITNEKDTKPYVHAHLDNITLSWSQYIATSIIIYGPYTDNMFALESCVCNFWRQLINVIKLKPPTELNQDIHLPKYNQPPMDTYSNTTFLIWQIPKQHQNFDHVWNHINDHPNMKNDTLSKQKRGNSSVIYNFLFGWTDSQDVKQSEKW